MLIGVFGFTLKTKTSRISKKDFPTNTILTVSFAFVEELSSSASSQYSFRGDVGELGKLLGWPSILLPPLLKPSRFFAFLFCTMFHSRSSGADISKQELNKSPELYVVTAGFGPRIFLTPFNCDSALNGFALGIPP